MQKITLVRLTADAQGRQVVIRDRSRRTNISVYVERFLQVQRVNTTIDLSNKLVAALKDVFKKHRDQFPDDIRRSGVNKIYEP